MTLNLRPVLVVDDDNGVLTMLGAALRRAGYTPTLVASIPAALQALATTRFVAVMTDYGVNHQTGNQVIEQARQLDPIPIIVLMTGHSQATLADLLVALPITAFLAKPFSLDTLYTTLAVCLPSNPAHDSR